MDEKRFRKLVKEQPVRPVYFLYGEEPYFIDSLAAYIVEQTVAPEMRDFNFVTLYGKEVDSKTALDVLMRYPMMAEYQVVQLKEAHQMRDFASLLPYFTQPQDTTVFLIEYKKKPDGRQKIFQHLKKLDSAFEANPVRDYQIAKWIEDYSRSHRWEISPENAHLLAEHLGTDLQKIVNELDKVMLNKSGDPVITTDDIEEYIGISKEYNVFELQKAVGMKEYKRAARISAMMAANEKDFSPVMIVSILYAYFLKVYKLHFLRAASPAEKQKALGVPSFFLSEYQKVCQHYSVQHCEAVFDLLYEYDLKSKGVEYMQAGSGALIKELVFRVMTVR